MSSPRVDHPPGRPRVILNTDAKNEADDQFAIVHAALTPSFDLRSVTAAHFGVHKHPASMLESRNEIERLSRLLGDVGARMSIDDGAAHAMADESTPVASEGARRIIEEARRNDDAPLFAAPPTTT